MTKFVKSKRVFQDCALKDPVYSQWQLEELVFVLNHLEFLYS